MNRPFCPNFRLLPDLPISCTLFSPGQRLPFPFFAQAFFESEAYTTLGVEVWERGWSMLAVNPHVFAWINESHSLSFFSNFFSVRSILPEITLKSLFQFWRVPRYTYAHFPSPVWVLLLRGLVSDKNSGRYSEGHTLFITWLNRTRR